MTRSHNPRWRRARGLAALAVPLALAAGVLPASGTALAQPTAPATTPNPAAATTSAGTTGSADQHHTVQTLSLPGLHDDSYSVTLLTGDQVRLTAAGDGHYSVVATPATGHDTVTVNATAGPDGVTTLQATPSAAQFLIASGQVDKALFDIQYLAAHGYTDNTGKAIPVTVQYTDHPNADTMTRRAGSLPASTVAATNTQTGTTDLRVDPRHFAGFWAALTGATAGTGSRSGLADGIAHIWLTGHRTSDRPAARPDTDDGQPTYPVTVTLTLEPGALDSQVAFCNGFLSTMCVTTAEITAVGGDNSGHVYAANLSCVDQDPCTTLRARFDVPTGSYSAEATPFFWIDAHNQLTWVLAPQVEVNGPTKVALDLSRLQHVDITTPEPTEAFNGIVQWQRTLPDGTSLTSLGFSAYGFHNIWTMPTERPVTLGAFHFSTAWVLGKPPVTAHVNGPKGFDLHPIYPFYNTARNDVVRFSGRQRLQVVDAGYGHPEDFAAIDARGKLAIIRVGDDGTGWCNRASLGKISTAQLDNAIKAGAAGVLIDPRTPNKFPDGWCALPIYYQLDRIETPPDMPFVAINPSEAIRLENLLQQHDVRVTVTDSGVSPYTYNLKFYEEGDLPGSLHYDVDNDQLTAVDSRLHADAPTAGPGQSISVWRPDEILTGGVPNELAWPARRTEYYGPASPDLVYLRDWTPPVIRSLEVFDQRGASRTEDLNARPVSPAPFVADLDVLAAQQPGKFGATFCAMCRQGNALLPIINLGQGSRPTSDARSLDPAATHLYLGDEEIPATTVAGSTAYVLPPERHTYRVVTDYDDAGFGHTYADWTFTSAAPGHDQTPPGTFCSGVADDPCRAEPVVFLNYDLGVDLNNQLAAPSVGQFTVTVSHQAADAPAIRDLKVWTSIDDGQHWSPALVLPRGRGEHGARDFSVITAVPPLNQTTGTLSIKAQATDTDGNSITQTLTQAVGLTQGTEWGWPGHRVWQ
ncbi:MAG TPA: hypothetical protein VIS06_03985 [Mycobacteriales bacterium]